MALCCHEPTFVTAHPKLLCPLVLSSLGESEPLVVGPLWEAVLLILSVIEASYSFTHCYCIAMNAKTTIALSAYM